MDDMNVMIVLQQGAIGQRQPKQAIVRHPRSSEHSSGHPQLNPDLPSIRPQLSNMNHQIPSQTCPDDFRTHVFEKTFDVSCHWELAWNWLMQPETFTKGQIWPYRVEFIDTPQPGGEISRGFQVGTLNSHHGPFMNFCGVIARVDVQGERATRDLQYTYGAHALAFRLIRPDLLRLSTLANGPEQCLVTVRVESYVRPWIAWLWTLAQKCFWPGFGISLRRACRANR